MEKIIARVVPQPKGAYNKDYNYNILDTVQAGAALYQSRHADNLGNDVTDKIHWVCIYDLSEAIKAATDVDTPSTETPSLIQRLMAIGTDGKAYAIDPKVLLRYLLDSLSTEYDIVAVTKK